MYSKQTEQLTYKQQCDLVRELFELVWEDYHIAKPMPTLVVKDCVNGMAQYHAWRVRIPTWIFARCEAYYYWYILHEACHYIVQITIGHRPGHGFQTC